MLALFRYYLYRLSHKRWIDFVDMGLGIEARYSRCRRYWDPHLRLCREFQERSLALDPGGGRVAVLGAGRLLDVDLGRLCERFDEVLLFDADPGSSSVWKRATGRYGNKIQGHIVDLTGAMSDWTDRLDRLVKGSPVDEEVISLLESLESSPPPLEAEVVLSMNLLSQIPIYWEERVALRLEAVRGAEGWKSRKWSERLERAIMTSRSVLQRSHLVLLERSNARLVTMVSDRSFLYYRKEGGAWQEEQAVATSVDGLCGYRLAASDRWFWHIAPQGIEQEGFGSIHDVEARTFIKGEDQPKVENGEGKHLTTKDEPNSQRC